MSNPALERAAQEFAEATTNPLYLFDLPPAEGSLPVILYIHGARWVFGSDHAAAGRHAG